MPNLQSLPQPLTPHGDVRHLPDAGGLRQPPVHPRARTDRTRLPTITIDDGDTPDMDVVEAVTPVWRQTAQAAAATAAGNLCDVSDRVVSLARRTMPWSDA